MKDYHLKYAKRRTPRDKPFGVAAILALLLYALLDGMACRYLPLEDFCGAFRGMYYANEDIRS